MKKKWCSPCRSETHDYVDCPKKITKTHRVLARPGRGEGGKIKFPAEYNIWAMMKQRCYNPRRAGYERWGGRGITVCARWNESFAAFLADVGPRPSPDLSIDRIDNDGNYEPGNVRWATITEQANNTVRSVRVDLDGEILTVREVADRLGLSPHSIYKRLRVGTLDYEGYDL